MSEQQKQEPAFPHCQVCGSSAWFCTVCAGQKQEPVAWQHKLFPELMATEKLREQLAATGNCGYDIPLYAAPITDRNEIKAGEVDEEIFVVTSEDYCKLESDLATATAHIVAAELSCRQWRAKLAVANALLARLRELAKPFATGLTGRISMKDVKALRTYLAELEKE